MGNISQADYLLMEERLRKNRHESDRPPSRPQPERPVRHEPLGAKKGKDPDPERFFVHVTSHRRRLIDPDNLCPKYFIDCLRYAGIIPNDRASDIDLSISQRKAKTNYTEIEVLKL